MKCSVRKGNIIFNSGLEIRTLFISCGFFKLRCVIRAFSSKDVVAQVKSKLLQRLNCDLKSVSEIGTGPFFMVFMKKA